MTLSFCPQTPAPNFLEEAALQELELRKAEELCDLNTLLLDDDEEDWKEAAVAQAEPGYQTLGTEVSAIVEEVQLTEGRGAGGVEEQPLSHSVEEPVSHSVGNEARLLRNNQPCDCGSVTGFCGYHQSMGLRCQGIS